MPSWYCIENTRISSVLREKGIPSTVRTVGTKRGTVFPASMREEALQALAWDPDAVIARPTSFWDTHWLAPAEGDPFADARGQVYLDMGRGADAAWLAYCQAAADWMRERQLPQPAYIHYAPGVARAPRADGALHLFFGGAVDVSFAEQEVTYERAVSYGCSNMWIGELYPHEESRRLLQKILDPLLPRIVLHRFRAPRVEIVPREASEEARPVLEEYADRFCRDIVLDVPHGVHAEPVDDGWLHIHVYSRRDPVGTSDHVLHGEICALIVPDGVRNGLHPSRNTWFWKSRRGEYPLLEVAGSRGLHLYVLCDLTHSWGDAQERILRILLDAWMRNIGYRAEEERYVARMESVRELGRERFISDGIAHARKGRAEADAVHAQAQERVVALQRDLHDAIRDEEGAARTVAQWSGLEEEERGKLAGQFAQLARRSYVRFLHYHGGVLSVYWEHVFIRVDNAREAAVNGMYDIGAMRTDISLSPKDQGAFVRVFNLTRLCNDGFHHPHVRETGDPCWGTLKHTVPELLAKRDIVRLCDLLNEYLHSVSLDDTYGRRIGLWPKFE